MTNAEQINKYELTADQVLKMLNLNPKEWKCEKNFSTSAVKSLKSFNEYKNTQLYEWEFYKKVNGQWKKQKIDLSKFLSKKGYNNYAKSGENGIVIVQPGSLAKAEGVTPSTPSGSSSNTNETSDGTAPSSDSTETEIGSSSALYYDVTGCKGNDEDIIKNVSFIKLCLIKECYEGLGILL